MIKRQRNFTVKNGLCLATAKKTRFKPKTNVSSTASPEVFVYFFLLLLIIFCYFSLVRCIYFDSMWYINKLMFSPFSPNIYVFKRKEIAKKCY